MKNGLRTFIFQMDGDSMDDGTVNSIADGDFIRAIAVDLNQLEPGKDYVIEDYGGNFYICVIEKSYYGKLQYRFINPKYAPFEIPIADIQAIYKIKLIERKRQLIS